LSHFKKYFVLYTQGRNEEDKGGTIPQAPNHYEDTESLQGCQMGVGGAEKS